VWSTDKILPLMQRHKNIQNMIKTKHLQLL